MLSQVAPGQLVTLRLTGSAIQVGGFEQPLLSPVRLVPVGDANPNPISYKGRLYRGEIEVLVAPKGGQLSVVNVINMEEYLLGVVPNEMPSDWPMEAYKAQAVAARTYATVNRGKWKADGFDLIDTVSDQAYGGIRAERSATSEAVLATKGLVLTYGGTPVTAFYHASSGGHTENNENVWNGPPREYLRGVPDFDNLPDNKKYAWSFDFSVETFTQKLKEAGYTFGQIRSVVPAGTLGVSGRPSHWLIEGTTGRSTLTAYQFRLALGLYSAPRTVQFRPEGVVTTVVSQTTKAQEVHVIGADGAAVTRPATPAYVVSASGTSVLDQVKPVYVMGGAATVALNPVTVTVEQPGPALPSGVEIIGGGSGHAVGMSQWGAHGMALQGKSFAEILAHFYTGTKVETH